MPEQASSHQYQQLSTDLYACETFDEAFHIYQDYVLTLGYEGVLYGFAPALYASDPLFNIPVYRTTGLYSAEFIRYYYEKELNRDDFTIKAIISGETDVLDWWKAVHHNRLTSREKRVLEIAKSYGLENGLTLPLMNNRHGLAGISIASRKKRRDFLELNDKNLMPLQSYTQTFNTYVWSHTYPDMLRLFTEPVISKLAPLEKEVLRWLPSGITTADIAEKTGRSPRYCENVLGNIRKKFGDITTHQLIYYSGLLRFNDYL